MHDAHKDTSQLFESIEIYRKIIFEMMLAASESDEVLFIKNYLRSKEAYKTLKQRIEDFDRKMAEQDLTIINPPLKQEQV